MFHGRNEPADRTDETDASNGTDEAAATTADEAAATGGDAER